MSSNNEQTPMKKISNKSGFTTVELLVTLFVAAAFLMSGYQLYAMIIKNNGEAGARAKAVNVAYQALQKYKTDTNPTTSHIKAACEQYPSNTGDLADIDTNGLSGAKLFVAVDCPYPLTTSISKLTVTVEYNYGGTTQQVTNATYVNKQ